MVITAKSFQPVRATSAEADGRRCEWPGLSRSRAPFLRSTMAVFQAFWLAAAWQPALRTPDREVVRILTKNHGRKTKTGERETRHGLAEHLGTASVRLDAPLPLLPPGEAATPRSGAEEARQGGRPDLSEGGGAAWSSRRKGR
uniref:Uncharacterized protein n=1 Tax=Arundo donax TaxID=35708 RepID=A0A0A9G643_ARUDO